MRNAEVAEERLPGEVLVLTFHAVDDLGAPLSFPPGLFAQGLERLKRRGYQTLTVRAVAEMFRTGAPVPERALAITFDDGYLSVSTRAFPVLERLGFNATVFLNTAGADEEGLPPMEGRERLRWADVRRMHEAGFEIGAHSISHPDLTRLAEPEIEREMLGSREAIEAFSGVRAESFAYPYGYHSEPVRAVARRHFLCACSADLAKARPGSDVYALERIEMHYFRRPALFKLLDSPMLDAYLRARRGPRELRQRLLRTTEGGQ